MKKGTMKKLLSWALTLAMLLTMLPTAAFAEEVPLVGAYAESEELLIEEGMPAEENKEEASTETEDADSSRSEGEVELFAAEFAGGSGTESDPYLIETKEHLDNVRYYPSAHYKMIADILFTDADFASGGAFYNNGAGWKPIGTFTGTFDGNNHTIKGLKQNVSGSATVRGGLFTDTKDATIKNLGMVDTDIRVSTTSGAVYAGSIVSYAFAGTTISNCYSTGSITATSSGDTVFAGGIAGLTEKTVTVNKSYNLATISGTASGGAFPISGIGGVIGKGKGAITECYNKGAVHASSAVFAEAGGIVGLANSGDITTCYNTGTITASDGNSLSAAGGIIGNAGTVVANKCYNTGAVSASSFGDDASSDVGGIVGHSQTATISDCYNTGKVEASGGYGNSGGILGLAENVATITNCYNTGAVKASSSGDDTDSKTGGIAAKAGEATISNCYNTGALEASGSYSISGGIFGMESNAAIITNCYNTGSVSGFIAGGIVGKVFENFAAENCYNVGSIEGTFWAGGILGMEEFEGNTFTNCYYLDTAAKGVGYGTDTTTKCTATQMKLQSTYAGFDFTNTWTMAGNTEYSYPEFIAMNHVGKDPVIDLGNTTEFAGGHGTEASPYLIANATHLNNVRNYPSAHFKMTADIVFADADFASGGAYYNNGAGWTPIGTFTGTFDGNNHIITGIKQNLSGSELVYGGLFGYVSGATIKNLGMVDSDISVTATDGEVNVGGIVGGARGSTIINCYNTGEISAESISANVFSAGIVGGVYGTTVTNCYNTGKVTATSSAFNANASGIVGCANGNDSISNCYNSGIISSNSDASNMYSRAAGIVGLAFSTTEITKCYNTGSATATGVKGYAGGIICDMYGNATIATCYNTGAVAAAEGAGGIAGATNEITVSFTDCYNVGSTTASNSAGGILGYACYGTSATFNNCYNIGAVTTALFGGGIVGNLYESALTLTNCYYLDTTSKGVGKGTDAGTKCTIAQMKNQSTYTDFDFTNTWTMAGNTEYSYPEFIAMNHVGKDPVIDLGNTTEFAGGHGTEESPYLIANATHLNNVRKYLNAHFKMTADITFDAGATWDSIGTLSAPFKGVFDGNNHTIKGLKQNIFASESVYTGLFGCASGATIKNLGMLESNISVSGSAAVMVGSIAGRAISSTISNCYNTGKVSASSDVSNTAYVFVGGIVGSLVASSVSECYNTGALSAEGPRPIAVGGVIGAVQNGSSVIAGCYNTGELTASSSGPNACLGGIVGSVSNTGTSAVAVEISECYNAGNVAASNTQNWVLCGGLVGRAYKGSSTAGAATVSISECYNTGEVSASSSTSSAYTGGLAGHSGDEITISNSYNAGEVMATSSSAAAYAGGLAGYVNSGSIKTSYNTGKAMTSGSAIYAGGIAGTAKTALTVTNCYYLSIINKGVGYGTDAGTKCTTAQMQTQSTYAGFDFTNTWTMTGNKDYPYPELVAVPMVSTKEPASIGISSVSTTSATLTIANNEAGTCYVAVYTTGGQMLSYGLATVAADAGEVTVSIIPFTTTSPYTVKAFLVDSQGIPVCQCAEQ